MSHKEKCVQYCKEQLQNLQLSQYFNAKDFEHIYRKYNGAQGNAFFVGLNAADFIIHNAKPVNHESGNEN